MIMDKNGYFILHLPNIFVAAFLEMYSILRRYVMFGVRLQRSSKKYKEARFNGFERRCLQRRNVNWYVV